MRIDEIIKLGEMGFTKEEIIQLAGTQTPTNAPDPEPQEAPQPTPTPQPTPAEPAMNEQIAAALENLNASIVKLQQTNIQNTQQPTSTETVDSILARIINPKE